MRLILGCTLGLLCLGTGLVADDKDEKIDAKKLVGKWEPKEGKKDTKIVIEFGKDGKATFTTTQDGKDNKVEGTYKVDGNKLTTTMKVGDAERARVMTVSKLTDTEMVVADDKGKETALVRIKDK